MLRLEPTNLLLIDEANKPATVGKFNGLFTNEKLTLWIVREKVNYNGELLETFNTYTDVEEYIPTDAIKTKDFHLPKVTKEFAKYLIVGDEPVAKDTRGFIARAFDNTLGVVSKEKPTNSYFATNLCIYGLPDSLTEGSCLVSNLGYDVATLKLERVATPDFVLSRYERVVELAATYDKRARRKKENVELIRDGLQRQSSYLHKWTVVYTFFGQSIKELDERVKDFKKRMERFRVSVDQPKFVQKMLYENRRPRNGEHLIFSDTPSLSIFYPFTTMEMIETGTNGVFLGTNLHTGSPMIYNRDNRQLNCHIAIVGASGGGKSMTTKVIINRLWRKLKEQSPAIVIVDPSETREYQSLAVAIGIPYKQLSEGIGIDPVVHYSIPVATGILRNLFKLEKPQEDVLVRVIESLKERKKTVFDLESEVAKVVKEGHEDEQVIEEYKKILNAVHAGMVKHSYIFKGEYPSGSFAVSTYSYDTDAIKAASTIVMLQTQKYFSELNKIEPEKPKFLIVDEGWMLIEDKYASETLAMISRTTRKNNVSLVFITQDPKDVLVNKVGSTILSNCDTKILMPTDSSSEIREALALSNKEENLLKTTIGKNEPGTALIIASNKHIHGKIQVQTKADVDRQYAHLPESERPKSEMELFTTKTTSASS